MAESLSELIQAADSQDPVASEKLFARLYAELHRIARRELAKNGWGVSLGATDLLHEAYLDLSKVDGSRFPDEQRFMGYAARVMRGLVIWVVLLLDREHTTAATIDRHQLNGAKSRLRLRRPARRRARSR